MRLTLKLKAWQTLQICSCFQVLIMFLQREGKKKKTFPPTYVWWLRSLSLPQTLCELPVFFPFFYTKASGSQEQRWNLFSIFLWTSRARLTFDVFGIEHLKRRVSFGRTAEAYEGVHCWSVSDSDFRFCHLKIKNAVMLVTAAPPLLFYVLRMQINLTKKEKRVKPRFPHLAFSRTKYPSGTSLHNKSI